MKIKSTFTYSALALLALSTLNSQLFGGTVITNNLPVNTAIININGTQDGAAAFNGDQSLF